ncbi:MAG: translation initiation factor IF-2 [Epsilonproteobacteria bacterium]|nr:translation initiation factor IF-2 [Campylobacterota bacterium]
MRVYELAKEFNISSKELVAFLQKKKFDVSSHMSIASDKAIQVAHEQYKAASESSATQKATKKSSSGVKEVRKDSEAVSSSLKREEKASAVKKKTEVKKVSAEQKIKQEETLNEALINQREAGSSQSEQEIKEIPVTLSRRQDDVLERALYEDSLREQARVAPIRGFKDVGTGGFRQQKRRKGKKRRNKGRLAQEQENVPVTEVTIEGSMPLFEVADLLGKSSGDLIFTLLKEGTVCNRNHILSPENIRSLAEGYGITVALESARDNDIDDKVDGQKEVQIGQTRWPVVVVMGHVDHGKTTLLDYVRKKNVAASEKGGITQHIRAWDVDSAHGRIVFLDTPGHEAFSYLRERGSMVTDIAVLVVAADDGIKPQTIEAINIAKDAGLTIIVAINKIDKISSNASIETVKRQLSQHELLPEDWGGDTVVVPISAKTGKGVDELLDMLVLQSQLLELKAQEEVPAKAFVLESHVQKGYGIVATAICREGVLKQGDFFVCDKATGKIRLLLDCHGKKITQAKPSTPVQIIGFDGVAPSADWLKVVPAQEYYKAKSGRGQFSTTSGQTVSSFSQIDQAEAKKSINIIIKTDTRGSREAIVGSIEKLSKISKKIGCPIHIISTGIGDITESDIELAVNTNARILGLHVKVERNAQMLAKEEGVHVDLYSIIYHMVEFLEQLLEDQREPEITWNKIGEAVVKKVFDIKGVGVIAGCYMRSGIIMGKNCKIECVRNGQVIGGGKIVSLQKEKRSVKEVHTGQECGFLTDSFHDWAVDDVAVCYQEIKEKK